MHVVIRPALNAPSAPPCIWNMGQAVLIAFCGSWAQTAPWAHRRRGGVIARPREHGLRRGIVAKGRLSTAQRF
eukprot:26169-Heterocapsa_arctica.AAC.1